VELELRRRQSIPAMERVLDASLALHRLEPLLPYVLEIDACGKNMAAVADQDVEQERCLRPRKCPF
jgi:hypothetical protein